MQIAPKMKILVMSKEDPPYQCPFSAGEDPNARGIPPDPTAILLEGFAVMQLRKRLGPATCKGFNRQSFHDILAGERYSRVLAKTEHRFHCRCAVEVYNKRMGGG